MVYEIKDNGADMDEATLAKIRSNTGDAGDPQIGLWNVRRRHRGVYPYIPYHQGRVMIQIIIVEDEKILRAGLALHTPWEKYGAVVIADATDGIEGAGLIEKLNPDIVITDIRMPGLSGIEMMRRLKGKCDSEFILLRVRRIFL
ncbi:hypothetical protein AGMMS49579_24690 [Spirochaetia bacterium]|nr:hypothetical protein AGMMS49579_24690 [Spirochaetia bacterium]